MVAAVDGMRFVVPVPAAFARPNRKFFGSKRGMTWLNAINDQGIGRGAKIVSGTVRDSLHMVDVIFGLDGGELPEIVVSDTGSYSDLTFGLLELLNISYRPALADLPDQKGWRIDLVAEYGPLDTFARGRIDLRKVRRTWPDILRVVASIYTGTVRAYDVVTMLQREGHPTALGEAIAAYGRIFKSLHIESYNGFSKWLGFGGVLADNDPEEQEKLIKFNTLLANLVVFHNALDISDIVRQLVAEGWQITAEQLGQIAPYLRAHISRFGAYATDDAASPTRSTPC
jgi:TnpA family transposase